MSIPVISNYIRTVEYHGAFHTVVVVTILAGILGPILGLMFKKIAGGSEWFSPQATDNAIGTIGV